MGDLQSREHILHVFTRVPVQLSRTFFEKSSGLKISGMYLALLINHSLIQSLKSLPSFDEYREETCYVPERPTRQRVQRLHHNPAKRRVWEVAC